MHGPCLEVLLGLWWHHLLLQLLLMRDHGVMGWLRELLLWRLLRRLRLVELGLLLLELLLLVLVLLDRIAGLIILILEWVHVGGLLLGQG